MMESLARTCTAFDGLRRIASGELPDVARAAKKVFDRGPRGAMLIFDDITSETIEVDFRGSEADVVRRLKPMAGSRDHRLDSTSTDESAVLEAAARRPGRPRLGVVAREVTLLPRHWDWLNSQSGGASVALRKLVESARKESQARDRLRLAQESAYRFAAAMAGDLVGFEESMRALFASDAVRFASYVRKWPKDIARHATMLANRVFEAAGAENEGSDGH
jgi:uncharacterized protein